MALSADTVAHRIALLEVDGLTIRELDKVPQAITSRDCPMVYPSPSKFLALEEAQQLTLGPNGLWKYTYRMTYRYISGPVGKERNIAKTITGKVTTYADFIVALSQNAQLIGAAHVAPASTPEWGVLGDPGEQQFEAADLEIRVVEFSRS